MSKPRGAIEHRQKLAKHPHAVEIRIPPAGLGQAMGELHAWTLKRCGPGGYADTSRLDRDDQRNPIEFAVFHFPTAEIARDFAAAFDQIRARVV